MNSDNSNADQSWSVILDQIESTTSIKSKVKLLKEHKEILHPYLDWALNTGYVYHIKDTISYDVVELDNTTLFRQRAVQGLKFDRVIQLLQSPKAGTFHTKDINYWLSLQPENVRKWYVRIIKKDLKCGVDLAIANKAGYDLPHFKVQLATDGNKCKKIDKILEDRVAISNKIDGYRCIAIGVNGKFTLYSRNGTIFNNFPSIAQDLSRLFPEGNFVFDGEVVSDDFSQMQRSAFADKRGTVVGDVKYLIFDAIPYDEWASQEFKKPFFDRYQDLLTILVLKGKGSWGSVSVVIHDIDTFTVDSIKAQQQNSEAEGYEGLMLKPNIPYYVGRSQNKMLKFKSANTQDCEILSLIPGKGKMVDSTMMGAMLVRQENGQKCMVGSGFKLEERGGLLKQKDALIGRVAEIKYQELTNDGIMRFPVFIRFRDDK